MHTKDSKEKSQLVPRIEYGTVIDHIPPFHSIPSLRILKPYLSKNESSGVAINVKGKRGMKDIVKLANVELEPEQINRVTLFAPKATINIIRDFEVVEKKRVELLKEYVGMIICPNKTCISNKNEPVQTKFLSAYNNSNPENYSLTCYYCERAIPGKEIVNKIDDYIIGFIKM